MTDFPATSGTDNFLGGSSTDRVIFTMFNQANFGDIFNGDSGVDNITIAPGVTIDLTPISTFIFGFEILEFQGAGSATFTAAQFALAFPTTVTLLGAAGSNQVVTISNASNFSAANWTFSQWNPAEFDTIVIFGTADPDSLTGSSQSDAMVGSLGNDVIDGGAGDDRAGFAGALSTFSIQRIDGGTTAFSPTPTL